ncbi:hypothetical protein C3984_04243 [Escherichia coli]|nr:hypothetical protein C3984_04243 [Escherichia coli]
MPEHIFNCLVDRLNPTLTADTIRCDTHEIIVRNINDFCICNKYTINIQIAHIIDNDRYS